MASYPSIANITVSVDPKLQLKRRVFQTSFFLLFIIAPVLNLFRLDLNLGHFIFLGQNWTLGLDSIQAGKGTSVDAVFNIIRRL